MNLGQAVAICLYELRRDDASAAEQYPAPDIADAADLERITASLLQILEQSGYVNERTASSTAMKVRRLVRRLSLPQNDIETWLGILRQINWKVGNETDPSSKSEEPAPSQSA